MSMMRTGLVWLLIALLYGAACPAWGQESANSDDVRKGHELAIMICANCHVAARDQPVKPIRQPPARSFKSIAQRQNINADSVQAFLTTAHKGLDNPKGMPNPEMLDYQDGAGDSYLLSLRKPLPLSSLPAQGQPITCTGILVDVWLRKNADWPLGVIYDVDGHFAVCDRSQRRGSRTIEAMLIR